MTSRRSRIEAFRAARDKYLSSIPFSYENYDKMHALEEEMKRAAAPEHVYVIDGEFMSDWVGCSCEWQSEHYWDGVEWAIRDWREHVAEEFGLLEKKCACGKRYIPADGGKPCHELKPLP